MRSLTLFILLFAGAGWVRGDSIISPAQVFFEQGKFDSAIVAYTVLLQQADTANAAHYNRGLSYYQLQQYNKAIADFDTCWQRDSTFKDALWMEAVCFEQLGQADNALRLYKLLQTRYPLYNDVEKRIKYNYLAVYISRNWYYMIAIMFMFILLIALVAKVLTSKRGI